MARQQIGSDSRPLPHLCCSPYLSHHNHIGDLTRIPPLYFFSCSAPVSPEGFFSQLRPMELERGERRVGRALLLRSPGEKIVYPAAPPVAPSMGRSRRGIPSSPSANAADRRFDPASLPLSSLSFPPDPRASDHFGQPLGPLVVAPLSSSQRKNFRERCSSSALSSVSLCRSILHPDTPRDRSDTPS